MRVIASAAAVVAIAAVHAAGADAEAERLRLTRHGHNHGAHRHHHGHGAGQHSAQRHGHGHGHGHGHRHSHGHSAHHKGGAPRFAEARGADQPAQVVLGEQEDWYTSDSVDSLSDGDKAFVQTLRAMSKWDVDERALFSCDDDRVHVRIGNVEEVADPASASNRDLSKHMQRYNLADPPSDCCRRYVKHGGSRMPLLEWLATTYFSLAIHGSSAMRVELADMLPSSILGFCRGINAEDGAVGGVHSTVRMGMQPSSALTGVMRQSAVLLDVCSGSTGGQTSAIWVKAINNMRRYVCAEAR